MDKKMVETFYGSFLHDIGKAVQRQSASPMYNYNHQILGSDFIENYTDDKQIIDALYYHHNQWENKKTNLRQAEIPEDSVAYLTYIGDNIAAGTAAMKNAAKAAGIIKRHWRISLTGLASSKGNAICILMK